MLGWVRAPPVPSLSRAAVLGSCFPFVGALPCCCFCFYCLLPYPCTALDAMAFTHRASLGSVAVAHRLVQWATILLSAGSVPFLFHLLSYACWLVLRFLSSDLCLRLLAVAVATPWSPLVTLAKLLLCISRYRS